jgi:DNA-binding beta-propeller fold protein YncE
MNTAIRAALTAALTLPLTVPAAASVLVPVSQFNHPMLAGHALPARSVFQNLHARHNTKKVSHFSFPYGIALDGAGNVYVGNVDAHNVVIVNPEYKVSSNTITNGIGEPVSLATDTYGDLYVGNLNGSGGNVLKYNSSLSLVQTITANAQYPYGIAVDQAQDLYLANDTSLSVDDPYGNSISSSIFGGYYVYSVAVGGPNVYAFLDGETAFGNTSVALRGLTLQYIDGPITTAVPTGSACAAVESACWFDDTSNDSLSFATLPGSGFGVGLSYAPAGLAVDPVRNRVYVADPLNNAIHVYNATTLAFEKTIT